MTCEPLPIWRPGEARPTVEADCNKDAATRKMWQEVSDGVVYLTSRAVLGSGITRVQHGSGFFVEKGDEIFTNAHVVEGARDPISVTTKDGKQYVVLVKRADPDNDLAVLTVQGLPPGIYKPLQFRPSESMQLDEDTFVLGHPNERTDVYISSGKLVRRGPLLDLLGREYQDLAQKYLNDCTTGDDCTARLL